MQERRRTVGVFGEEVWRDLFVVLKEQHNMEKRTTTHDSFVISHLEHLSCWPNFVKLNMPHLEPAIELSD